MIGWAFLPDLGARLLLRGLRHAQVVVPPLLGFKPQTPPPLGSHGYAIQQRISFSVVILLYLIYTSIQAYLQAPPNFYELLGVFPEVDESTLKTAFRNFARYNHPDKVGASGEQRFIAVRDAFDTLKSSTKRSAYDKFGPDVVSWAAECTTVGDYLERGLMASSGFYLVSAVAMLLYAIFGQSGFGAFWRYNLFFSIAAFELLLILSPPFPVLTSIFPSRVAFQHIRFLHQFFISMSIAITRIGPAIMPIFAGTGSATPGEWEQERTALYAVVKQVTEIAARLDREISRMIYTELKAAHGEVEEIPVNIATASEPQASNTGVTATPAKITPVLNESDRATSFVPSPGSSKKTQRYVSSNPALRTPASQERVSNSTATAGLGGMELDNNIMRLLSKEVEDMVIEKNIKRHPMLARIWNEAVSAGRIASEREREARLFGAQQTNQPLSQSQTTAVDIPQQLHPFPNSRAYENDSSSWKSSYMQRRARSEEHSASPPPILSKPALGPVTGITSTPPPSALRNLSRQGSDVERLSHTRWSSASSSFSGLPRTGSDLVKRVDAERAKLLREIASSPGPDVNLTARPNGLLQQHHHHRLSVGDPFPVLPRPLETPSPESSRSDLDPIVGAIRSRSMSLVN
ncbi:hypothetical protein CPB86DRAFT_706608 [Serendipita vermifera]|nr:hypothetical protein CPB86DRAFT_706608 [Serendipita vermifera]